ncbi:MAG: histidine kinase [Solirubrobacteraceae bacterium]|nr:histidine kinase [Solirubrobacteraceae bacterium]
MTDAPNGMPRGSWRHWSTRSQVERIGIYTRQSLYFVLVISSAFVLLFAVNEQEGEDHTAILVAGGAAVTAASLWVLAGLLDRYPELHDWRTLPRHRIALLVALSTAYGGYALLAWPETARGSALAVTAVAIGLTLGALPGNRVAFVLIVGGGVVAALHLPEAGAVITGLFVPAAFVFTTRASLWIFGIVRDLDDARHAQSELAVMEERLRFSRDVHDVLGRRLSTIAVQAELAATLAGRGDDRAPERMLEVREVAHQALREARELARGYRTTNFGQELEGARSLLLSAGIEVVLEVDDMPKAWHEAAGWVVRESVTNVLRHSDASTVEIAYGRGLLQISNDGSRISTAGADVATGSAAGSTDGAGLHGLRERLAPLGASLSAGPVNDGRWTVVVDLPGAGPLTHRAASMGDA